MPMHKPVWRLEDSNPMSRVAIDRLAACHDELLLACEPWGLDRTYDDSMMTKDLRLQYATWNGKGYDI